MPTISGGNYPKDAVTQRMTEQAGRIYDPGLAEDFFRFLDSFSPSDADSDAAGQD